MPKPTEREARPGKEKVARAFDSSRFDHIDISDDEESFHPNIEKNFNIKINRTVRDRKIDEMDVEKDALAKQLEKKPEDEKAAKKLQELEKKQIWHAGNMFETKEEKSAVLGYGKDYNPNIIAPGKEEGMNSTKDVDDYMQWRKNNLELLDEFVVAGGDLEATRKLLISKGDLLVDSPHAGTYLMLTCLEEEM